MDDLDAFAWWVAGSSLLAVLLWLAYEAWEFYRNWWRRVR